MIVVTLPCRRLNDSTRCAWPSRLSDRLFDREFSKSRRRRHGDRLAQFRDWTTPTGSPGFVRFASSRARPGAGQFLTGWSPLRPTSPVANATMIDSERGNLTALLRPVYRSYLVFPPPASGASPEAQDAAGHRPGARRPASCHSLFSATVRSTRPSRTSSTLPGRVRADAGGATALECAADGGHAENTFPFTAPARSALRRERLRVGLALFPDPARSTITWRPRSGASADWRDACSAPVSADHRVTPAAAAGPTARSSCAEGRSGPLR